MTLQAWLELLTAVFQAPGQVLALVRLLKGTPEEQRQALMAKLQSEADSFAKTGRPDWN